MLRGTLLYLSEHAALRRMFSGPLARPLVRRFVAGETLNDATAAVRRLNDAGLTATLDYLGESVTSVEKAGAAALQIVASAWRRSALAALIQLVISCTSPPAGTISAATARPTPSSRPPGRC